MSAETMRYVAGNRPVGRRLNVKHELALFRQNPLFRLIKLIQPDKLDNRVIPLGMGFVPAYDPVDRFIRTYRLCYLSLERLLPEMSALARGDYSFPYAKGVGFNESHRLLAEKYHISKRFFEFDLLNALVHFRILADRTIGLSRYFIHEPILPSFTSFNEHRKFFRKLQTLYGTHEKYAEHIRKKTSWFDLLKTVRDDFLVHDGPKHMATIGYTQSDNDPIILFIPRHQNEFMATYKGIAIQLSIRRLILDINQFLRWFDRYGCKSYSGCAKIGRQRV